MPEVRVQDEQGRVHVFPDGSTPEMIAQAMGVKPPEARQRTAMDSVGDFVGEFWKQVNPVAGIKGAAEATAHPIETFKADTRARQQVYQQAEDAFKQGKYTEGAAHLLYSVLPLVGPQLNEAANNFLQGKYAKGAGASTGMAANVVAPEVLKNVTARVPVGTLPERMYQSALKPSTTMPTSQVQSVVKTGLEAGIPVSKEGVEKLGGLIDDLNTKIRAEIKTGSQRGVTIDPQAVAQRADALKAKFSNQVNPNADLQTIDASKAEFLQRNPNPIPAADAQALKQGTYQQLKSKSYGELKSASVEAQKALARGIKEELSNAFPEVASMNAREAKFFGLDEALERAVRRIDNHQLFGIGTPIAAGAGGVLTGSPAGAAVSGILKLVLDNPAVKSKLAIALSRAKGGITPSAALSRIVAYSDALGNASSASSNTSQQ